MHSNCTQWWFIPPPKVKPRHFFPISMNHPNYSCSSFVRQLFMKTQVKSKNCLSAFKYVSSDVSNQHEEARGPPCQFQIVLSTDKLDRSLSECWRLSDLSDDQEGFLFSVTEWTFPFRNSDLLVSPNVPPILLWQCGYTFVFLYFCIFVFWSPPSPQMLRQWLSFCICF